MRRLIVAVSAREALHGLRPVERPMPSDLKPWDPI